MCLLFLPRAKSDLKASAACITRKSGDANVARNFVQGIRQKCEELASHSFQMGSSRPELGEGVHSYTYGNYLILFQYTNDAMEVIMIVEAHRDIEMLL